MFGGLSLCLLFILLVDVGKVGGEHSVLTFDISPNERSTQALACGLLNSEQALCVRFDTKTQECTTLPDSWFTNRTTIQGSVYSLLKMYEEIFEPTMDTGLLEIPGVFGIGSTIVVTFHMEELAGTTRFRMYVTSSPEFMLLSMGLRHDWNLITYNSFKNGSWGEQENSELLVNSPNTTYLLEILVAETNYQISLDGLSIYNFTKRYTEAPVYFKFKGDASYCRRVQYYFGV